MYKNILWPSPPLSFPTSAPPASVPKLGHLLGFPTPLNAQRMPAGLFCLSPPNILPDTVLLPGRPEKTTGSQEPDMELA